MTWHRNEQKTAAVREREGYRTKQVRYPHEEFLRIYFYLSVVRCAPLACAVLYVKLRIDVITLIQLPPYQYLK